MAPTGLGSQLRVRRWRLCRPTTSSETVVLDKTQEPADVYAVRLDERDWYVKLYLTVDIEPPHDDATVCVSFHPPRYPMTTTAGRKVMP